jgi:hypothetical protein
MADSAVAQFTEITGASPETATQYLQLTDYNLQTAMQLYFENGGAELQLPNTEAPAAPPTSSPPHGINRSAGYEDEHGVVHIDSDADTSGDDNPVSSKINLPRSTSSGHGVSAANAGSTYDDDLAMARRLQEELYASGDTGVRAPMRRTTETLVGPDMGFDDPEDINANVMRQMHARRQARSSERISFAPPHSR